MTDAELDDLYEGMHGNAVYEEPSEPTFGDARQVELGNACVDCRIMFDQTQRVFPLFSGRPNSSRGTDKRCRCQSCAIERGVVSAKRAVA